MAKILIIEDEDHIRTLLGTMLEQEGYEVLTAQNGKEGIKVFHSNQIDLIITDIFMPEKEGLETITELKKEFPDVKIIAISGGGQKGNLSFLTIAKHIGANRTLNLFSEAT
ncbi:MAG TPA: response regulator [Thermodesulfovibrionia bacterium]|nr:response regulator [Thermodesulfovibrionia bacterium]